MCAAVIGVEHDHHAFVRANAVTYSGERSWRRRTALNESDAGSHRVRLDSNAVMSINVDIDANGATIAHRLEQAGVEDQRSAVRYASFDDDVRPQAPDDFLHADHVLRQLHH